MPATNRWILLLLLIFAGFAVLSAWSFFRAARGASPVTDRSYYSHGLRYNQTLLEQRAAAGLGWDIVPSLRGRLVTIQLRDQGHRAVAGALGSLTLLGSGRLPARELSLREIGPGVYQAEFPADLRGEQAAEITFQRDGARLSKRLLLTVN